MRAPQKKDGHSVFAGAGELGDRAGEVPFSTKPEERVEGGLSDQNARPCFSQHVWEWEVLPIGQPVPRAVRGAQDL